MLVYRRGSKFPDNLTPRPEADADGLSTFDSLERAADPGEKAQVIDTNKMIAPASLGSEVATRLGPVFAQMAARIGRFLPGARYAAHHGSNENFPWWVVARFAGGTDEGKAVDVSVECQRHALGAEIRADVARESGLVLTDFQTAVPDSALREGLTEEHLQEVLKPVGDFLLQQADRIGQELAQPQGGGRQ